MSEKVWENLWTVLESNDQDAIVYVYRLDSNGEPIKPCLLKCEVWPELPDMLRDGYGGGHFRLLIRKKRIMIFSGDIAIISDSHNVEQV